MLSRKHLARYHSLNWTGEQRHAKEYTLYSDPAVFGGDLTEGKKGQLPMVTAILMPWRNRGSTTECSTPFRAAIEVVQDENGQYYVAGYGEFGGGIWVAKLKWRPAARR